jgi:uncharacterized delta-60 repeat protein
VVLGLLFATGIAAFAFACGSDPSPECAEQACPDSGSETSTSADGGLDSTSTPDARDAAPDALDASDASDAESACPGPAGTLDPTFGDGGLVWLKYPGAQSFAVATQPDGKVVIAGGTAPRKHAIVRLLADGSLDPGFGSSGLVETTVLPTNTQALRAVVVQPDGKIVAAGAAIGPGPTSYDFVVLRYNANGTPDPTFGTAGAVVTDFGNSDDYPRSIALQADGRILVAGQSQTNAMLSTQNFTVARYETNGTLDATFGTGGRLVLDVHGTPDLGGLVSLVSGKMIISGASGTSGSGSPYQMAAARLDSNGSLDTSFANGGKLTIGFDGTSEAIAYSALTDASGRLVLGGAAGNDLGVLRLTSNGANDVTFGNGGRVVTDFSGRNDVAASLLLQDDGKVVAVGNSQIGSGSTYLVASRYLESGSLDVSFGTVGRSETPSPTGTALVVSAATASRCSYLVTGTWSYDLGTLNSKTAMGIARYRR